MFSYVSLARGETRPKCEPNHSTAATAHTRRTENLLLREFINNITFLYRTGPIISSIITNGSGCHNRLHPRDNAVGAGRPRPYTIRGGGKSLLLTWLSLTMKSAGASP